MQNPPSPIWRTGCPRTASRWSSAARQGAIAQHEGARFAAGAPEVAVRDTIGAGDVFNAAFLAALAADRHIAAALSSATATASLAIST